MAVTGADRLLADLAKVEGLAHDLRPVWPKLARMWADREAGVLAAGRGWAPFSAKSLIRHARSGKPPMVASGSLVAALTTDKPRFQDENTLVLGPPKPAKEASKIGVYQQRGTTRMPARKLVPNVTAAERRRMVDAMRDHLRKGLS